MGTPFSFSLAGSGLGKGAPVRVPPAGGARPSRPSGLRADTLPTLGGRRSRRPPRPAPCGVWSWKCGGWSPPAAAQAKPAASRCTGAPLRNARPSPCGAGRRPGLALLLPRAGCGAGAPGRPGPHCVGAVGPSAPPARSAALRPAVPARPRLRRRPCRPALPTHSPPGVAARGPSLGVPPPSQAGAPAAGCCAALAPAGGRNLSAAR